MAASFLYTLLDLKAIQHSFWSHFTWPRLDRRKLLCAMR
jgi:hypothetical protein